MWVNQAQIERAHVLVAICDSNENGTIESWVTLVRLQVGLGSISSNAINGAVSTVVTVDAAGTVGAVDNVQRGISSVQLRHPKDVLRTTRFRLCCGDVAVVGTNFLPRKIPLQ